MGVPSRTSASTPVLIRANGLQIILGKVRSFTSPGRGPSTSSDHCSYWDKNKKDLVDPTKRVQGGRLAEFTSTKSALNAANHNYKFSVDPDEVERAWQSIDPLLRELLAP